MKPIYAAEFLIVGDFDDILVPDHGTYYDEFIRLAVPNAAALVYNRFHVHITTAKNASYFSLFDTLMSAKVDVHIPLTPKYVANTAMAESLWIHSPYIVRSNCIFQSVPVMEGRMFHLRKWHFLEDDEAAAYNKSISEDNNLTVQTPDFSDFSQRTTTQYLTQLQQLPEEHDNGQCQPRFDHEIETQKPEKFSS
uniref:Glycosyltransferase family 92 protein n=2 Tax=Globodera rostochiensis TaxID=31243 RepID=A0A914H1S8_GLORO